MSVEVADGATETLHTAGATIQDVDMTPGRGVPP